jgi:hypothetical protein
MDSPSVRILFDDPSKKSNKDNQHSKKE